MSYANSDKKTILVLNTEFAPPALFNAAGHALLGLAGKASLLDWKLLDYPATGFETHSKISEYPVVVLRTKRSVQLEKLARQLFAADVLHNVFLDAMIGSNATQQQQATRDARPGEARMICLALFGAEETIRPLIKSFSVYKASDAVTTANGSGMEIT